MVATKIGRLVRAAALLILCLVASRAGAAADFDSEITVYRVDMKGTGLEEMVRGVFQNMTTRCSLDGHPIQPIPQGDTYTEILQQRYYAPGMTTIYETSRQYEVQPDCTVKRRVTEKIDARSVNGNCNFNPALKIAKGLCAITVAGVSNRAPLRGKIWGEPTGAINTIAGQSCKTIKLIGLLTDKLPGELCVADSGPFANVVIPGNKQPGIPLKLISFGFGGNASPLFQLEATKITSGVKVPISVLAPQLTTTYEVRDFSGWRRESR